MPKTELGKSITGVVHNGVITLPPEVNLPEGTEVFIVPEARTAVRLHRHAESDPHFEKAIAAIAAAEVAESDPLEGGVIEAKKALPAQSELRKLLAGG